MNLKVLIGWMGLVVLGAEMTQAATRCVDSASTGGDGQFLGWTTAASNIQDALSVAVSNDVIWVAGGTGVTYKPTTGLDRTISFVMKSGVNIYGGFTNGGSLSDRDWNANPTTLSGDIGVVGATNDNSYHVVIVTNNMALDGFTITAGQADGTGQNASGAGIWATNVSPILANCILSFNNALSSGGGMWVLNTAPEGSKPMAITACSFVSNVSYAGGAAGLWAQCNTALSGCTFRANALKSSSNVQGGGAYLSTMSNTVTKCTFISNTTGGGNGGGLGVTGGGVPCLVNGCTFVDNTGGAPGGGTFCQSGSGMVLTNCTFSGNNGAGYGSGSAVYALKCSLSLYSCVFAGGIAPGSTYNNGAVLFSPSNQQGAFVFLAQNCLFAGHEGYKYAGALSVGGSSDAQNHTAAVVIASCTFSGNHATDGGAIVATGPRLVVAVTNSIFWGDGATSASADISNNNAIVTIRCSDINTNTGYLSVNGGSLLDGGGNLNVDPAFAKGRAGSWSATGTFSAVVGQTTLTDTNANWTPGELTGVTVNPNTNQWRQFVVVANTKTNIVIWGNAAKTSLATNHAPYQVWDYHLKSRAGRYVAGTATWVQDAVQSQCIDAGDRASAYTNEPAPNGGRINMGFEGNTAQASESWKSSGTAVLFR